MSTQDDIADILNSPPPARHYLFWLGPFSFYWIWINEGSEHQHRGWVANWHTRRNLIHLMDWRWWVPLRQMPRAFLSARRITDHQ